MFQSYRIDGPPIQAFDRSHGAFIPDVCASKITYKLVRHSFKSKFKYFNSSLEEIDGHFLVKREVGSSGRKFGEFVGARLITYDIVNINQV